MAEFVEDRPPRKDSPAPNKESKQAESKESGTCKSNVLMGASQPMDHLREISSRLQVEKGNTNRSYLEDLAPSVTKGLTPEDFDKLTHISTQ